MWSLIGVGGLAGCAGAVKVVRELRSVLTWRGESESALRNMLRRAVSPAGRRVVVRVRSSATVAVRPSGAIVERPVPAIEAPKRVVAGVVVVRKDEVVR